MAALEDIAEEFKSATPGGKALMLVAIIVVAGLGYYVYKQKQSANSNTAGTLVPLDLSSLNSGGGSGSFTGSSSSSTTTKPPPIIPGRQVNTGHPIQYPINVQPGAYTNTPYVSHVMINQYTQRKQY